MLEKLSVRLTDGSGQPIDGVLVAADWFWHNVMAWGSLVGLTDQQGQAEISGVELRRAYRHDQKTFPMDYKVAFEEFEGLEIVVEGGEEFAQRLEVAESPLVVPSARLLYAQARNQHVPSARTARLELQPVVQVDLRFGAGAHAG